MNVDTAINWIDRLLKIETGKHLNDLQIFIIGQVWQGQKYIEIATNYHCTEGHVKDIAAALWQLLSQLLGERVTKTNLKSILQRHVGLKIAQPHSIVNHQFIGREGAIARLDELIGQGQRTIVIQGEGGVGKTILAQQYLKTCGCDQILELSMAKETAQITPAEIIIEEWLRQDLQLEPGREFGVALLRLKRQLSTRKIGILIDNLEPALDRDGRIMASHRNYVELLRVLTDRQLSGVTLITSRDRLCEIDLNLIHYRLSGLDLDTWQTYLKYRQIDASLTEISPLHQTYGGNAKAMEIIAGNIYTDFIGGASHHEHRDITAYLATRDSQSSEAGLKQLISNQFDRLQRLDLDAYQLLCRAGCYRYQDLSRVNIEALQCLLWDVDPAQRSIVVNSLKNRSLIEFQAGKYWLHPAIRAEAIARLRHTESWIKTHQQAANYWSSSVDKIIDIPTAITALEAYYHYVEIDDFSQAAMVLLQPRDNQWGQFLPLASNLYRMGSIQPVLAAITRIISVLPKDRFTAELANILGDLYWIIGLVHQAIETQQQTIDYTTIALAKTERNDISHQTHCLNILNIDSLLSLGLYQLDLWELNQARSLFKTVIKIASNTVRDRWAQKAIVCLALVESYLNNFEISRQLLTKIEAFNIDREWTGSSAYFLQKIGQTYTNLGDLDRAETIYQRTLTFCQTGNYLQTQGRTLTSLAQVNRLQGKLEIAQAHHLHAIEILDRLGAKCDLAEAYHQAGLTWQQAGDLTQSHIYRELYARKLFTEINAPQQLAKIEASTID
jgi:tetratricopeptide (TPR) repeat protein